LARCVRDTAPALQNRILGNVGSRFSAQTPDRRDTALPVTRILKSQDDQMAAPALSDRPGHIYGLDSLRFLAALWVLLSHGGMPYSSFLYTNYHYASKTLRYLMGFYHSLPNGGAAVILFFVISGLCIHLPYAAGKPFLVGEFLARRYARVGIPLVAAILIAKAIGGLANEMEDSVLWTLYCELIYYTAYPLIRILTRTVRLQTLVALIFAFGSILAVWKYSLLRYQDFTILGSMVLGLPYWLLGTLLAERFSVQGAGHDAGPVWKIEIPCVLAYTILSNMLVTHASLKIGYPASLIPFGLFAFVRFPSWLAALRRVAAGSRFLRYIEHCGRWSYSLYLMHPIALGVLFTIYPRADFFPTWPFFFAIVLGSAVLSYYLVERPSHIFAREIAGRLRARAVGIRN
jgi:peptidoglycan/LPS O-acetylase OafA/YrhL